MRLLSGIFISLTSADSICSPFDMEQLDGGRGLFDLIMSCAHLVEPALIRDCVAPKLDLLSLTSDCGECTGTYITKVHTRVSECSATCAKELTSTDCNECKEKLGLEWETACFPDEDEYDIKDTLIPKPTQVAKPTQSTLSTDTTIPSLSV